MSATKTSPEEVLREFPPIGKYRIRLVRSGKTKTTTLDIREYVSTETFEGFTRRGIRITERAQVDLLRDICAQILDNDQLFGR